MLSTVSATHPLVEQMLDSPFQSFENGFTPWDCFGPFPCAPQSPKPVGSSSGSDVSNRSDQNTDNSNSNSDSDAPAPERRKCRRVIWEPTRRCRMRKQKHVENLRNLVSWLRSENLELQNRLRSVLYHFHSVRTENDWLQSEHSMLRNKLSEIRQILMMRQLHQFTSAWPCDNIISATEEIPLSSITS
ncbi:hypothetical protein SADUNF_Sadunf07G0005900 [Salix dunnii]|uniref:BZIP domain-containing protein n=1 Tax=Salix dunnii TaxID=1413687 RepID=A0A835JYW6_9ROSI|nr:hypothetical protein SADUNF_Sadunf07G0005900 [Salix dunnii]